jgi:hypothetical protein
MAGIMLSLTGSGQSFLAGLNQQQYSGFFNNNPAFFPATNSAGSTRNSPVEFTGIVGSFTSLAASVQWLGYFYAPTSDDYTFSLNSDGGSFLWIGSVARSDYTTGNATVNNSGTRVDNPRTISGAAALVGGNYYPLRIQWGISYGVSSISRDYVFSFLVSNSTSVDEYIFRSAATGQI